MIKDYQHFELFGKKAFGKAVIGPPFQMMAEMPYEACFYYLISGQVSITMPETKLTPQPGEGLLLECGNYIGNYSKKSPTSPEKCEVISIHLYPEVLKVIYEKDFTDLLVDIRKVKPIKFEHYKASKLLKTYIDSLQFYFDNPEIVSDELLKIKIKELMLLLVKTGQAESVKNLINGIFSSSEIDFKSAISANLYNNLSLQELAKLCKLSISSFKREFGKHFDESPAKYIKRKKLERAVKMLQSTELRITDIAYECGFLDSAHFSKSFKSAYNYSPKDFREHQPTSR